MGVGTQQASDKRERERERRNEGWTGGEGAGIREGGERASERR